MVVMVVVFVVVVVVLGVFLSQFSLTFMREPLLSVGESTSLCDRLPVAPSLGATSFVRQTAYRSKAWCDGHLLHQTLVRQAHVAPKHCRTKPWSDRLLITRFTHDSQFIETLEQVQKITHTTM